MFALPYISGYIATPSLLAELINQGYILFCDKSQISFI